MRGEAALRPLPYSTVFVILSALAAPPGAAADEPVYNPAKLPDVSPEKINDDILAAHWDY
jgi:hypothetical protein